MRPGIIEGVEGRACVFTRNLEKNNLKVAFQGILETFMKKVREVSNKDMNAAKKLEDMKPTESSFRRRGGARIISDYERKEQHGIIQKENRRTVWISFGTDGLTKVKKQRVTLT